MNRAPENDEGFGTNAAKYRLLIKLEETAAAAGWRPAQRWVNWLTLAITEMIKKFPVQLFAYADVLTGPTANENPDEPHSPGIPHWVEGGWEAVIVPAPAGSVEVGNNIFTAILYTAALVMLRTSEMPATHMLVNLPGTHLAQPAVRAWLTDVLHPWVKQLRSDHPENEATVINPDSMGTAYHDGLQVVAASLTATRQQQSRLAEEQAARDAATQARVAELFDQQAQFLVQQASIQATMNELIHVYRTTPQGSILPPSLMNQHDSTFPPRQQPSTTAPPALTATATSVTAITATAAANPVANSVTATTAPLGQHPHVGPYVPSDHPSVQNPQDPQGKRLPRCGEAPKPAKFDGAVAAREAYRATSTARPSWAALESGQFARGQAPPHRRQVSAGHATAFRRFAALMTFIEGLCPQFPAKAAEAVDAAIKSKSIKNTKTNTPIETWTAFCTAVSNGLHPLNRDAYGLLVPTDDESASSSPAAQRRRLNDTPSATLLPGFESMQTE